MKKYILPLITVFSLILSVMPAHAVSIQKDDSKKTETIVEHYDITEHIKDNTEVNQEENTEKTKEGVTGTLFVKLKTVESFNYVSQVVILNQDTYEQTELVVYSTNDFTGQINLPAGNYKIADVMVQNDYVGTYSFETGQTFVIDGSGSIEIEVSQMELVEEEKPEEIEETKEVVETQDSNTFFDFVLDNIFIVVVAAALLIFLVIYKLKLR